MNARPTASTRLGRLLVMLPWIAAQNGPTVDETCERFGISREELIADLNVVFMVGLPPYTPDTLIEVAVEDERIWLNLGDYFRRPLRLTPSEALAVLVATKAAVGTIDNQGALARGLAKLQTALGTRGLVDVSLGPGEPEHLGALREAIRTRHRMVIAYYSNHRDALEERPVDPWRLVFRDGYWYLLAWCHQAEGERLFRVDRIAHLKATSQRFDPPAAPPEDRWLDFEGVEVTLRLNHRARWVAEHVPTRTQRETPAGVEVTLVVSGLAWLARLLVRLGPDAEILAIDGADAELESEIRSLAATTARRILRRYELQAHR